MLVVYYLYSYLSILLLVYSYCLVVVHTFLNVVVLNPHCHSKIANNLYLFIPNKLLNWNWSLFRKWSVPWPVTDFNLLHWAKAVNSFVLSIQPCSLVYLTIEWSMFDSSVITVMLEYIVNGVWHINDIGQVHNYSLICIWHHLKC